HRLSHRGVVELHLHEVRFGTGTGRVLCQDYLTFEKPPARVVFSFTGQEITRGKKGSQEDPL
ncbi:hypothetical protein K4G89_20540, partial [Mycobacterium tuberculosis]|nr:hypothetical protein [Mycobacterium tuberculosis]